MDYRSQNPVNRPTSLSVIVKRYSEPGKYLIKSNRNQTTRAVAEARAGNKVSPQNPWK